MSRAAYVPNPGPRLKRRFLLVKRVTMGSKKPGARAGPFSEPLNAVGYFLPPPPLPLCNAVECNSVALP